MNSKRVLGCLNVLGISLCLLGVLFISIGIRNSLIPVINAEVLEIQNTGYIHGAGDDIRNEHTEDIMVKTEDGQIVVVTMKSMDKKTLPVIGDTIKIYRTNERAKEYTGWYEKSVIWFVYAAICLFFGGEIILIISTK